MWYSLEITDSAGNRTNKSGYYYNKRFPQMPRFFDYPGDYSWDWGTWMKDVEDWMDESTKDKEDGGMEWISCIKGPSGEIRNIGETSEMGIDMMDVMFECPGFSKKHLNVMVFNNNVMRITGKKGILRREDFEYEYKLGKNIKVEESNFENGVLIISLRKEIPEEEKPVTITIQ